MTFVAKDLPKDPENAGWVKGWGVVQNAPWVLIGVFHTKQEAEEEAAKHQGAFEVKHGSHRLGSDDFVSVTKQ